MRKYILIIIILTLKSCVTLYQPQSFKGGYSSTQLDPKIYRVVFNGNGFTNRIYAQDMALLRCSEIALENGYKYFIIIEGSNTVSQSTTNQPTRSRSDFKISESYDGYRVTGNTYSYGGGSYTISKPSTQNTILLLKEKDQNSNTIIYDALFLKNSLREKYSKYIKEIRVNNKKLKDSQFYLGIGAGYAFNGNDLISPYFQPYSGGISLNLINVGYRFNKNFGVTADFNSSLHQINNTSGLRISLISAGPMISIPISKFKWDFKPQYARMIGNYYGDLTDILNVSFYDLTGWAYVFGNSFVLNDDKRFSFSLNLDFVSGKFDKKWIDFDPRDDNSSYSNFRMGLGVRYNF